MGRSYKPEAKPCLGSSTGACLLDGPTGGWSVRGCLTRLLSPEGHLTNNYNVPVWGSSTCLAGPCPGGQGATDSIMTKAAFLETPCMS